MVRGAVTPIKVPRRQRFGIPLTKFAYHLFENAAEPAVSDGLGAFPVVRPFGRHRGLVLLAAFTAATAGRVSPLHGQSLSWWSPAASWSAGVASRVIQST